MFSSYGLQDWELVVVCGIAAVAILCVSTAVGALVAHVVLREGEVHVAHPATSPGVVEAGVAAAHHEPARASSKPRLSPTV